MALSAEELREIFLTSLQRLLAEEPNPILDGVSERNTCGRLAIHIELELRQRGIRDYFTDVEYNRKQNGQLKTMLNEDSIVINITPDLILHSQGNSVADDNLIAIEAKKFDRPPLEKEEDRSRLKALTRTSFDGIWSNDGTTHPEHVCGYKVGAFIELNRKKRICTIEFYRDGARSDSVILPIGVDGP